MNADASTIGEASEAKVAMKVDVWLGIVWAWVVIGLSPVVWAVEVPYTLEDRDRLIRVEATLKEFKDAVTQRIESVDKRIESVDKRIESVDKRIDHVDKRMERLETVMMGGFGLLFTSMIGLVGFVLWDRRSALAPAVRGTREIADREERLERALKEVAQRDPNVAEALRRVGLL